MHVSLALFRVLVRRKRVAKKEQLDRLRGTPEDEIVEKRPHREHAEELAMIDEVTKHGHLIGIGGPPRMTPAKKPLVLSEELVINDQTFDINDPSRRPKGWAEVKLRRVYIKEWQDRKLGVDESTILLRRFAREQEVS